MLRSSNSRNLSSVKASTRRRTPVWISASTCAFTFSTPASASTTGVASEGAAARLLEFGVPQAGQGLVPERGADHRPEQRAWQPDAQLTCSRAGVLLARWRQRSLLLTGRQVGKWISKSGRRSKVPSPLPMTHLPNRPSSRECLAMLRPVLRVRQRRFIFLLYRAIST
jgi:hypothetical protein